MASKHCGSAVKDGVNGWVLEDLSPETIAENIRRACVDTIRMEVSDERFGIHELGNSLTGIAG